MLGWLPMYSSQARKRADKDHAHKKAVRQQKKHLREIKSQTELRQIMLAGRHKQKVVYHHKAK